MTIWNDRSLTGPRTSLVKQAERASKPSRGHWAWRLSATAVCLVTLPLAAQAQFTPSELAPGTHYRLIFVTSGTTAATSGNVSIYNSFATSQAALNPALPPNSALPSVTWSAIVSTESTPDISFQPGQIITSDTGVNAVSNLDNSCNATCQSDPIYLVTGATEVAASQAGLFSGTLLNAIDETQTGTAFGGYVWTGSTASGTVAPATSVSGSTHGVGNTFPEVGLASSGVVHSAAFNFFPVRGTLSGSPNLMSIYAISSQLTVASAPTGAPEPMSGALLLTGGVATGLARRLRRRRRAA
jgi:hypothetical protein